MPTFSSLNADEHVKDVKVTSDTLIVTLADGRTISVPEFWDPRLLEAAVEQRAQWEIAVVDSAFTGRRLMSI